MSYDILLVGAGLTSATIAAKLKKTHKICVIDIRSHIGGNCYDYKNGGKYFHAYGPHFFHSPDRDVVSFLNYYTGWYQCKHTVSAEVQCGMRIPFPFSNESQKKFIFPLNEQQVVDLLFKPYSLKMWGKNWEDLPDSIKNRVPKILEKSEYFPDQFVGVPLSGYTTMFENMFDGVDVNLSVDPDNFLDIDAKKIVYCGRPDHIRLKNGLRAGNTSGWIDYRNIKFIIKNEEWDADTDVVNFCHLKVPYTRKTHFGHYFDRTYPAQPNQVLYELPCDSRVPDLTPFYPIQSEIEKVISCKRLVEKDYPNITFAGRIGNNAYIDMWQAVNQGLHIADRFVKDIT